jgi:hypothetical protein
MTSDGLPAHEMAACLAAGEHPHLMSALGRITEHPRGMDGLLMPLAPAHWRPLADPPSLESCSRDVYDPGLCFSAETARRLLRAIAGATAHLHGRGLMHGDLYAHNIMWDGAGGEAKLTDFGAACALPLTDDGADWRRIESRAFGLLAAEILARCPHGPTLSGLHEIARACIQQDVRARPSMADVARVL